MKIIGRPCLLNNFMEIVMVFVMGAMFFGMVALCWFLLRRLEATEGVLEVTQDLLSYSDNANDRLRDELGRYQKMHSRIYKNRKQKSNAV